MPHIAIFLKAIAKSGEFTAKFHFEEAKCMSSSLGCVHTEIDSGSLSMFAILLLRLVLHFAKLCAYLLQTLKLHQVIWCGPRNETTVWLMILTRISFYDDAHNYYKSVIYAVPFPMRTCVHTNHLYIYHSKNATMDGFDDVNANGSCVLHDDCHIHIHYVQIWCVCSHGTKTKSMHHFRWSKNNEYIKANFVAVVIFICICFFFFFSVLFYRYNLLRFQNVFVRTTVTPSLTAVLCGSFFVHNIMLHCSQFYFQFGTFGFPSFWRKIEAK